MRATRTFLEILNPERGEGRNRNTDVRNIDWLPLVRALTRDRTCNPGVHPDKELHQRPSGVQRMPNPLSCTSEGSGLAPDGGRQPEEASGGTVGPCQRDRSACRRSNPGVHALSCDSPQNSRDTLYVLAEAECENKPKERK